MAPRPVITHVIVGLNSGGAERCLQQLIDASADDYQHEVICLGSKTPIGEQIAGLGAHVQYLPVSPANPLSWLTALWRGRQLLRQRAPDLVQGWMYLGNIIASLFYRYGGRPGALVWNVRSDVTDLNQEKWTTRLAIRLAQTRSLRPDMIIYNSHAARDSHAQFGFDLDPGTVIVNGVDSVKFSPDPAAGRAVRAGLGIEASPCIGLVGRFHPVKGVDVFLQAAASVMEHHPSLQILLAGEGMQAGNVQLEQFVAAARLPSQHVHLLGPSDAVADVFNALDVLVLASRREGTPNVLLEAMACGIACVSTAVGDVPRLLVDPQRLAPVGDAQGLAKCILAALENPRQWQESDHETLHKHYTVAACVASYRGTYANLLG